MKKKNVRQHPGTSGKIQPHESHSAFQSVNLAEERSSRGRIAIHLDDRDVDVASGCLLDLYEGYSIAMLCYYDYICMTFNQVGPAKCYESCFLSYLMLPDGVCKEFSDGARD